jgi:endo-alpha-1,4-polygalactosaminidase (GH114 family)
MFLSSEKSFWSIVAVAISAVGGVASLVIGLIACRSNAGQQAIARSDGTVLVTESITTHLPLMLAGSAGWWQPMPGSSWQWQLSGSPIDQSFDVAMYDVDMFDTDATTVAALHAQGRVVVCYISVGSWEDWRPDAGLFPTEVLGNDYEGWPGEKWLDIRRIDLLAPIMRARLDMCREKGFDGVEPDNVDGFTNNTGFSLTYQDQLAYNIWLAGEAHARGLSIGLKNDGEQAVDLAPHFDWAMVEDCFADDWCEEVAPFTTVGKAVFAAEYTDQLTTDQFLNEVCPQASLLNLDVILKERDLDAWRLACP